MGGGGFVGAVIQHRIRQYLTGQRELAAVAREQGEGGGEPASGAQADDGDARRVDIGLRGEPLQGGVAVVERRGVGVLGRQAVANTRRNRSELIGEAPTQGVALHGRADDEASAVEVEDARATRASIRRRGIRAVDKCRAVNPHGGAVAQIDELAALRRAHAADAGQGAQQPAVAPRGRGARHEPRAREVGVEGGGVVVDHAPTLEG